MIKKEQIETWIEEARQRASSAPLIIQYIGGRLQDLSERNEALLAENIELRTGKKVDEYEGRIAALEYQLEILKRQMTDLPEGTPTQAAAAACLLIYNPKGQVLRVDVAIGGLQAGQAARLGSDAFVGGAPHILITQVSEELLLVFDSGRTETLAVEQLAPVHEIDGIDWQSGYVAETRGGEELAAILPVGRMALYDACIQISRRGCAKKMMRGAFENHIGKSFIGTGVKSKLDKTCALLLCGKQDLLVLATREGYLLSMTVEQLPYTTEEILKLGTTDYVVAGFIIHRQDFFVSVTQTGKVIHREVNWLEEPASFKSRGQPVFSQARREAGTTLISAAGIQASDWYAALDETGAVTIGTAAQMVESGALALAETAEGSPIRVVDWIILPNGTIQPGKTMEG